MQGKFELNKENVHPNSMIFANQQSEIQEIQNFKNIRSKGNSSFDWSIFSKKLSLSRAKENSSQQIDVTTATANDRFPEVSSFDSYDSHSLTFNRSTNRSTQLQEKVKNKASNSQCGRTSRCFGTNITKAYQNTNKHPLDGKMSWQEKIMKPSNSEVEFVQKIEKILEKQTVHDRKSKQFTMQTESIDSIPRRPQNLAEKIFQYTADGKMSFECSGKTLQKYLCEKTLHLQCQNQSHNSLLYSNRLSDYSDREYKLLTSFKNDEGNEKLCEAFNSTQRNQQESIRSEIINIIERLVIDRYQVSFPAYELKNITSNLPSSTLELVKILSFEVDTLLSSKAIQKCEIRAEVSKNENMKKRDQANTILTKEQSKSIHKL